MPGSICQGNIYSCPVCNSKPLSLEQCSSLFHGVLVKLKIIKTGFICSFLCNCCLASAFQPEASGRIAMCCVCLSVFLCVSLHSCLTTFRIHWPISSLLDKESRASCRCRVLKNFMKLSSWREQSSMINATFKASVSSCTS